jgi:hemoglobin
MMMKSDHITKASIKKLVDSFYAKVMEDTLLRPIFLQAIGEDPKTWEFHMQRMHDFWSSIMLGSGRYHGNPFQKHKDLPAFDVALFDRWLILFAKTAQEIHTEEVANRYIEKSNRIAESLKMGLSFTLQKKGQQDV